MLMIMNICTVLLLLPVLYWYCLEESDVAFELPVAHTKHLI